MAKKRGPTKKAFSTDSFTNFAAGLGLGANNLLSGSDYNFDFITRNRTRLEAAYRTSWVIGAAVDFHAEDMTQAGISVESTEDPKLIQERDAYAKKINFWPEAANALRWARLFGGCILLPLIDGQAMSTPLRPETIRKGQLKGFAVLDRWLVYPDLTQLVQAYGPDFGKPEYYKVVGVSGLPSALLQNQVLHHSRVIRFEGFELPYYQKFTEMLWGQSVVERIYDRLVAFDSTTAGAAQLVFKAYLRSLKIKGLRSLIAAGGPPLAGLSAQLAFMRTTQSNEGITVLDADDDFQTYSYAFSGLDGVLLQFSQQLSGALQMPLVRLLGQSPSGLNASGESDLRTYYDGIKRQQETVLTRPIRQVYDMINYSLTGKPLPEDFNHRFNPLWQTTDKEKAEIGTATTTAVKDAFQAGIIGADTALRELRQNSRASGLWSNITDADITEAENRPPVLPEDPNAETTKDDDTTDPEV